jgi:serine/threonine protein kinase
MDIVIARQLIKDYNGLRAVDGVDFSIAKVFPEGLNTTAGSAGLGTPAYMAPEQLEGAPADPRFDVYALGITIWQMLARPVPRWDPYQTPLPGVYLCSSATPPGPAVHGMCGLHAARRALRDRFGIRRLPSLAP